jgi:hypothetical protein
MVLMSDVALPFDAVREQLSAAIDFVVHVARAGDGSRQVTTVAEVTGSTDADRVHFLAVDGALHALPQRPTRAPGPPPDAGWLQ